MEATLDGSEAAVHLRGEGLTLTGTYADRRVGLRVEPSGGRPLDLHSRRHGRPEAIDRLALTLTGTQATVLTEAAGRWTARARVDLADVTGPTDRAGRDLAGTVRDPGWAGGLRSGARGTVARLRAGGFGQLGLRDVRLVTHADGSAVTDGSAVWLTATSAGPGFFATAHASVWRLDTAALDLTHTADLFARRHGADGPGVYGDHAVHLLRADGRWLLATSTWGDFDRRRHPHVGVGLGRSDTDLRVGRHVVDTAPLDLPTDGLRSVGTWDPHLVRDGQDGQDAWWRVGFVSARRFFAFHPVLAAGTTLDDLALVGADPRRVATEGSTLHRGPDGWRLLASDGRDGRRGSRARYPVLAAGPGGRLVETGTLAAAYPSNLPWPTLVPAADGGWLLVTFDGTRHGGPLAGYGTHGDLVVLRGRERPGVSDR